MNQNANDSLEIQHTKMLKLGLLIDIFLPLALFFLTVYLRDKLIQVHPLKNLDLFFYILLAVSLTEVGAIFIIKRQFSSHFAKTNVGQGFSLAKTQSNPEGSPYEKTPADHNEGQGISLTQKNPDVSNQLPVERNLMSFAIIIFAVCFSPTIYGFIYYLLGGTWERFALFVAITFLLFQLFKPKLEELEKLSIKLNSGS